MGDSNAETVKETPGLNILLVEDEEDIALPIADILGEEGHDVAVVHDGERAMRAFELRPFDLVISDIRLPRVDGLTLEVTPANDNKEK